MYVLLCSNNTYYCGITNNLEKRLKQHNGELKGGAKYTRSKRPCKYLYIKKCLNRSDALKKEYCFKKLSKNSKKKLISLQD